VSLALCLALPPSAMYDTAWKVFTLCWCSALGLPSLQNYKPKEFLFNYKHPVCGILLQ
jgi:hypothetical protein